MKCFFFPLFSVEENFKGKGKSTGVWHMEVKILHRFSALGRTNGLRDYQENKFRAVTFWKPRTAKLLARWKWGCIWKIMQCCASWKNVQHRGVYVFSTETLFLMFTTPMKANLTICRTSSNCGSGWERGSQMEIEALVNKVIFEISNRHIQPGCWRSLRRVRKKSKIYPEKVWNHSKWRAGFSAVWRKGLYEKKCLSAYHKNSKFPSICCYFTFLFSQTICD